MRKQRRFVTYVRDMLESARKAQAFVKGMDYPAFEADEKMQYAVVGALEVIGEAAKTDPPTLPSVPPLPPW